MRQSPSIYNKTPNPEPEDSKSKGDSPMNNYSVHNPLRNTAFNNIQSKNFIPTQENDIFTTSNSNGMGNTMRNFAGGGGSFKPMNYMEENSEVSSGKDLVVRRRGQAGRER